MIPLKTVDIQIRKGVPDSAERVINYSIRLVSEPDIDIRLLPWEFSIPPEEERKLIARFNNSENQFWVLNVPPSGPL